MYHVQFPGLGINITISPVAFRVGSLSITWYGIIIAAGFLLAFLYAASSCKKFRVDEDRFLDAVIGGGIGGVIGARLYYILFYPGDTYLKNPLSIFFTWEGGLGIYGGIIGGVLCGALIAKLRKLNVPAVLDLAALGFLIGQAIGRWGNFVNQEAFGRETSLPWGMLSERTAEAASGPVHPCFLYESLWCALGFVLLHIFSRKLRRYDGQVFLLYLIWYGAGRFFIEGLRTDSLITPFVPIRVSQLVAVLTVLAAAILLVVFRNRTSLAGCGSAKIMELNVIVDEVPDEMIDGGAVSETESGAEPQAEQKTEDAEDAAPETPDTEKTDAEPEKAAANPQEQEPSKPAQDDSEPAAPGDHP